MLRQISDRKDDRDEEVISIGPIDVLAMSADSIGPRCVENRTELVAEGVHHVDLEAVEVALDGVLEFVPRELAITLAQVNSSTS